MKANKNPDTTVSKRPPQLDRSRSSQPLSFNDHLLKSRDAEATGAIKDDPQAEDENNEEGLKPHLITYSESLNYVD